MIFGEKERRKYGLREWKGDVGIVGCHQGLGEDPSMSSYAVSKELSPAHYPDYDPSSTVLSFRLISPVFIGLAGLGIEN